MPIGKKIRATIACEINNCPWGSLWTFTVMKKIIFIFLSDITLIKFMFFYPIFKFSHPIILYLYFIVFGVRCKNKKIGCEYRRLGAKWRFYNKWSISTVLI